MANYISWYSDNWVIASNKLFNRDLTILV
jgi:hypothetical protein